MAPTLTPGTNSYIDLTFADAYFLERFGADEWVAADDTTKTQVLIMATRAIDRQFFKGAKKGDTAQALQFPRRYNQNLHSVWRRWMQNNVQDIASEFGGEEWGVLYFEAMTWISETDVPDKVKRAQCEEALAILIHYGTEKQRLMLQRRGVQQFSIGGRVGLSEVYKPGSGKGLLSIEAREELAPYLAGGVAII